MSGTYRLEDVFPGAQGGATEGQLAARFEELLADVRAIAGPLTSRSLASLTPADLLLAPEPVRLAYHELVTASQLHAALRGWQCENDARRSPAPESGEVDHDWWPNPYAASPRAVGTFFDCRRFPDLAPGVTVPLRGNIDRPGPSEPVARLLWLATDPTAEPWMPSRAARDARWREFLALIAQRRRERYAAERVGMMFTR